MSEWRPIETAPLDGTRILLHEKGYVHVASWVPDFFADGGAWVTCDLNGIGGMEYLRSDPSHWLPCPNLPEGDNHE